MKQSKTKLNSSLAVIKKKVTKLYVKDQETYNKLQLDNLSTFLLQFRII